MPSGPSLFLWLDLYPSNSLLSPVSFVLRKALFMWVPDGHQKLLAKFISAQVLLCPSHSSESLRIECYLSWIRSHAQPWTRFCDSDWPAQSFTHLCVRRQGSGNSKGGFRWSIDGAMDSGQADTTDVHCGHLPCAMTGL